MEKTLFFIKPDAVKRNLVGKIITRVEDSGFRLGNLTLVKLKKEGAEEFYQIHKGKEFFDKLIESVSSGPVVAMVLEKDNAVKDLRELVGATDPQKAKKGSIRSDFGLDVTRNSCHASDSPKNAPDEILFFFPEKD
ncbi:MAG: nucleoside diphosphate kinase [candidate division Zixibacteria bacterium SM23_73_2]|nr:MAG: nucleoside diphosphate kinase [candidate division Zixibacteria bacterium SM23_73_2]